MTFKLTVITDRSLWEQFKLECKYRGSNASAVINQFIADFNQGKHDTDFPYGGIKTNNTDYTDKLPDNTDTNQEVEKNKTAIDKFKTDLDDYKFFSAKNFTQIKNELADLRAELLRLKSQDSPITPHQNEIPQNDDFVKTVILQPSEAIRTDDTDDTDLAATGKYTDNMYNTDNEDGLTFPQSVKEIEGKFLPDNLDLATGLTRKELAKIKNIDCQIIATPKKEIATDREAPKENKSTFIDCQIIATPKKEIGGDREAPKENELFFIDRQVAEIEKVSITTIGRYRRQERKCKIEGFWERWEIIDGSKWGKKS